MTALPGVPTTTDLSMSLLLSVSLSVAVSGASQWCSTTVLHNIGLEQPRAVVFRAQCLPIKGAAAAIPELGREAKRIYPAHD